MKYIDEYRDRTLIRKLSDRIAATASRPYTFMEVCGGHTMALHKFGIPALLPDLIRLKTGPGCPVCVTGKSYIDRALAYARTPNVIVCTYGDLLRVPGSHSSLYHERAAGADIRIVYSLLEAMGIARENPSKRVVFLGIGFETTAPGSAVGIVQAHEEGIKNFHFFSSHKLMPPAMEAIVEEGIPIDGYLCPGHVSTITGSSMYEHLPGRFGLACVISGFEPSDMLQSVLMLIEQLEKGEPQVEIQYRRAVRPEGNPKAKAYMNEVFEPRDDWWRGLGKLPESGLKMRDRYRQHDAEYVMPVEVPREEEDRGCICGEILKGAKDPTDCTLFGSVCTPVNPVGACMVSSEGACQAFYKYKRYE
jgi:hydrogenase expression/formation protein HypD